MSHWVSGSTALETLTWITIWTIQRRRWSDRLVHLRGFFKTLLRACRSLHHIYYLERTQYSEDKAQDAVSCRLSEDDTLVIQAEAALPLWKEDLDDPHH